MPRGQKRSPRKSRAARERLRGADGLFLSTSGHRKSTGRYVGMSGLAQTTAAAYARLDALHDHKFQLDVAKIELDRQRALRKLGEKKLDLDAEQRAVEERDRRALREAQERFDKDRADAEQRAEVALRAQESKAAEQRERAEEQQIEREKQLAEAGIQAAESLVKTLVAESAS